MSTLHQEEASASHLKRCEEVHEDRSVYRFAWSGYFAPFLFLGRCVHIARRSGGQLTNDAIRYREVRLIESDGDMIGVVSIDEAKKRAEDQNLDLVLIANNPENPVCKIMDYGKFLFEKSKKEKEARKNQKVTEVKEVGMKLTTEEHDLNVKVKNACRFLKDGDRVKVLVKYRGREMAYQYQGYAVMEKFAKACEELGQIDRPPKIEGRNMVMYLAPKKE
ncbi:MAG: translation initiation factor IF-3 [Clostridiales bacterium]|nr:translation initiation factor IF-3 [Clostridiales bacterium]